MKARLCVVVLTFAVGIAVSNASAQQSPPPQAGTRETTCTFQDGQQITIQYPKVKYSSKNEPEEGRPWMPGGKPVYLFSQATLTLSGNAVTPGAYSVYMVPGKKDWTIIVNKDVTKGAAYDQTQDLGKVRADVAKLPDTAKRLKLYFGHVAPKTCNLRIDFGNQRAYGDFTEQ